MPIRAPVSDLVPEGDLPWDTLSMIRRIAAVIWDGRVALIISPLVASVARHISSTAFGVRFSMVFRNGGGVV
ncbi:hypothetical protein D3C81_2166120 [compost metagenome]